MTASVADWSNILAAVEFAWNSVAEAWEGWAEWWQLVAAEQEEVFIQLVRAKLWACDNLLW